MDRHEPPFIRRFVVYFRTAVYTYRQNCSGVSQYNGIPRKIAVFYGDALELVPKSFTIFFSKTVDDVPNV